MRSLLFFFLLSINFTCNSQTYVQVNGVSLHDRPGYNGFNWGAGVEQGVSRDWTVAAGWYYNSERRGSTYAYARYAVYKNGPWDLGIGAGVVTGYSSYKVAPMAFPEVCYSYLCAIAIPQVNSNSASAVALHLRVPI
jgi:hypothetical protein